jgi:methionine-rich copper-binding protein CopC
MSRSIRRALTGAALSALLPLAFASAHAELDSASPGPDEVVAGSPPRLVARFTQDIAAERTSIEVRDADGQTVARGGKDPDRARVQRVELPPLQPGTYEVRWVTFSTEDDELARGRYRFTVTDAPATPAPTLALPEPCPSPVASPAPIGSDAPIGSAAPIASPAASAIPSTSPGAAIASPDASPALGATPGPIATADPCATPAPTTSLAASPIVPAAPSSPEASLAP